jgi:hypothetical protein
MNNERYRAGVCNIGHEEIARRRVLGWSALAVTLVLLVIRSTTGIDRWWGMLVFFPASISAAGFLQARFHFCVGFARSGVFNFSSPGTTHHVPDEYSRARDRKRSVQVIFYSAAIGAASAIACVFIL